jgi:hypothetical protein
MSNHAGNRRKRGSDAMGRPGAGGEIGARARRAAMSRQVESEDPKSKAAKGFGKGGQERRFGAPAVIRRTVPSDSRDGSKA